MTPSDARSFYYALRRDFRIARKNLLADPAAFGRCCDLTSYARKLTGKWETGFDGSFYWVPRRGRTYASRALQQFLSR